MKTGSPTSPALPSHQKASAITRFLTMMLFIVLAFLSDCTPKTESIPAGEDDISGVITGPNGPEAGVWVIAETHDLPTRFAKIVVADDQGRYLIPDLPEQTIVYGSEGTDW